MTVRSSRGDLAGRYISSHCVLRADLMLLFLPRFPERTIFQWPFPRLMRMNVPPSLPVYVRLSAFADDCGAKGLSAPCQTAVGLAFTNFFFMIIFFKQFSFAAAAKHSLVVSANATAAVVNGCEIQNFFVSFLILRSPQVDANVGKTDLLRRKTNIRLKTKPSNTTARMRCDHDL